MPPNINDNESGAVRQRADPDAHGQAALLLVEAMLHALVEAKVFTARDARSIVETAVDVKIDVAEAAGEATLTLERSLQLLRTIAFSLREER